MKSQLSIVVAVLALTACQTTGSNYKAASENLPTLAVAFASTDWTGRAVPNDGICTRYGGKGNSPALVVSNVPAGADAIIVEFSDRSYSQMDFGGHGKIGYPVDGKGGSVSLASVPGDTKTLPNGAWVEANNLQGVGYRGPCSGGRSNMYEADVLAVKKAAKEGEPGILLAKGQIRLGNY